MRRRPAKQRRSTTRVQAIGIPAEGLPVRSGTEPPPSPDSVATAQMPYQPASGERQGPDDSGVERVVELEELLAHELDARSQDARSEELDAFDREAQKRERERKAREREVRDQIRARSTGQLATSPPDRQEMSTDELTSGREPVDSPVPDDALGLDGWEDPSVDIFSPGTVLEGKFEIQHRVGRGAMGEVFLAKDVYLKREVAVKALSARHRADEVVERFRSEAESMAQVDHPNVVKIFSFGSHEDKPYFVMEFLDGESLAEYIDRAVLMQEVVHLDEVIGLLSQVCRGLGAIHEKGIVHRDVKPANVMITTTYRVALADFGLVGMITDDESEETAVYGTPVYIAPERFESRVLPPELTHSCDIYALGIILYELLTGEVPFDDDDLMTLLNMHTSAPVPSASKLRPDIPPAIDDVIRKAMSKRPEDRYPSAEAFRDALLQARDTGVAADAHDPEFTALVVEHDARAAVSTVRAVSMAHPSATVLTVGDGDTALTFIRELRPDLIILDADAPGLNALELCALLQEEKRLVGVDVLVLSPRADAMEANYLRELGVTDVMQRPVSGPDLAAFVRGRIRD